jgi:hypothetical protein
MLLIAGAFLALSLGYSITLAFFGRCRHVAVHPILKLSFAAGVGLCASGACYFCGRLIFPNRRYGYVLVEILIIGLATASASLVKSHPLAVLFVEEKASALTLILVFSLVTFGWVVWSIFTQFPHGGWDAFAIWNLKARYLFASGSIWKDRLFSQYLAHPDYPLGLPSIIAGLWQFAGKDSTRIPLIVGCGFSFATLGLLYGSLIVLRGRTRAILAVLTLLSTPFFLQHSVSQYADVPLSFLFLAAIVLLTLHELDASTHILLVFAGFVLGFAAWIKNEGLLFVLIVAAVRGVLCFSRRGLRAAFKESFFLGIGAAPLLLIAGYFKLYLAPGNDLISGWHFQDWLRLVLDVQRHAMILKAFAHEAPRFGAWLINPVPFLLVYLFLSRPANHNSKPQPGLLISGAIFASTLAGYYVVFAIQPLNLAYLLDASLNRLLLQLWPIFLFHVFLYERVGVPEAGRHLFESDAARNIRRNPPAPGAAVDANAGHAF